MAGGRHLRSIGFDLPDNASAGRAGWASSPVGRVLARLHAEIDQRGASARHLSAIRFDGGDGAVRVTLREQPLAGDYPSLAIVFGHIARACTLQCVGTRQLSFIVFEEDKIKLVLINAKEQAETYVFPVRPAGTS